MVVFKVAVLAGDGIGPEVMAEVRKVLTAELLPAARRHEARSTVQRGDLLAKALAEGV